MESGTEQQHHEKINEFTSFEEIKTTKQHENNDEWLQRSIDGMLSQTIHDHLVGIAVNYFDENVEEQQQEANEENKTLDSNDGDTKEREFGVENEIDFKEEYLRLKTRYQALKDENERLRRAYIVETVKAENTAMCTRDRELDCQGEKNHLLQCLQVRTEHLIKYENEARSLREELKNEKEKSRLLEESLSNQSGPLDI